MSEVIYTPGLGLGDNWYAINKLLRSNLERIYLSRFDKPTCWRVDVKQRLLELFPLIEAPVERFRIVDLKPTNHGQGFFNLPWDIPYFSTKKQWKRNTKTILYQFDGRYLAQQKGLPTEELIRGILLEIERRGYKAIKLGSDYSLEENVSLLSEGCCFLGTSSGISHLAHSVGIPICLVLGAIPFQRYHAKKEVFYASSLEEANSFLQKTL